MQMNVHDNNKYVSIWLTKAEAADTQLRELLTPLYQKYQDKKYRVVVFESGKGDLPTLTRDLLKHNLDLFAQNEPVQQIA